MKHLVIDADSLAYRIPHAHRQMIAQQPEAIEDEESDGLEEFEPGNWAKEAVQKELDYFLKLTNCETYELHLTASSKTRDLFKAKYGREPNICFRYEVSNDLSKGYKSNRKAEPIEGYEDVMRTMMEDYDAHMHDSWEADDAVVWIKNNDPDNIRLCALDKDVLNQCVGEHYNYGKIELHTTTEEQARFYKYWQTICGDPGDGYGGVPGIGKAKAGKFIWLEMDEVSLWEGVVTAYESKGLGVKEALATMRLASMQQLVMTTGSLKLSIGLHDCVGLTIKLFEEPK